MGQVTTLLAEIGAGRREALDALYALLYGELRPWRIRAFVVRAS
jgi:hypothetical protein